MADLKAFVPAVDPKKYANEFREFLLKTNMFSLAMGVVIGNAVGKVVASIVGDLVMPVVGILSPEGSWRTLKVGYGRLQFTVGNLLGTLLDFLIIASVVFLITKMFVKQAPPPPPPPTKICGACKEAVHPEATKCKFCTSDLPPLEAPKLVV
jgi:large conductance mechanosensitive channel